MKVSICLKISRLLNFNQTLLKFYFLLYKKCYDSNNLRDYCGIIEKRIQVRKGIKNELQKCIDQLKNSASPFGNFKINFLTPLLKLEEIYTFPQPYKIDLEEGDRLEAVNLRQYYNTLYSDMLPIEVTDLLLTQKNKIEENLLQIKLV